MTRDERDSSGHDALADGSTFGEHPLADHDVAAVPPSRSTPGQDPSDSMIHLLASASSLIFWRSEADGSTVAPSPSWMRYTGQTAQEAVGLGWACAVHPDDRQRVEHLWRNAVEHPGTYNWEYRVCRHDREWRWIAEWVVPTFGQHGALTGWVGMSVDVNELKLGELRQNQSDAQYRAVLNASAQLVWIKDKQAQATMDSWQSWCEFTGQTETDWLQGRSLDCVHPDDQERVERIWKSTPSVDATNEYEYRLKHHGGQWRWMRERVVPLRDCNGALAGWVGMTSDITLSKQAQSDIVENESRYRALVEATAQVVWRADPTGKRRKDSPTWRGFTGLTAEEYFGERWIETIHPDDRAEIIRSWKEAIDTGSKRLIEYRLLRSDGQWRWMLERSIPYEAGWVSMAVDVSDIKSAEKALADRERHLRLALKSARMAAWHLDNGTGRLYVEDENELLPTLAQYPDHLEGLSAAMKPSAALQLRRLLADSNDLSTPLEFEFELIGGTQPIWLSMSGRKVPSSRSEGGTLFGVISDITGRKLFEDRRNLLIGEIAHRGKNLLAVVQAIAATTFDGPVDALEASEKFQERLATLGRSHSLLTDKDWYGVPLDEIVRLEIGKFSDRANIDVVSVTLNPSAAQNCALVFHELITNAVKYGALSVSTGQVTVRGYHVSRDNEDCIRLEWTESGGPTVQPPMRQGFGIMLLRRLVSGFDTDGRLDYDPDGFRMEVDMPCTMIQPTEAVVARKRAG